MEKQKRRRMPRTAARADKAHQPPQRVVGVGGLHAGSLLRAHFLRHPAVQVVDVLEGQFRPARRPLPRQVPNAVVFIFCCKGAALRPCPLPVSVVAVAGAFPVQPCHRRQAVHLVVAVAHRPAVRVAQLRLAAVVVVAIAYHLPARVDNICQQSFAVILVFCHPRFTFGCRQELCANSFAGSG